MILNIINEIQLTDNELSLDATLSQVKENEWCIHSGTSYMCSKKEYFANIDKNYNVSLRNVSNEVRCSEGKCVKNIVQKIIKRMLLKKMFCMCRI